jgi:hypothetical protein
VLVSEFGRLTDRANAMTGTSPADDTRFGSSNTAEVARGVWKSCIYEMPFVTANWDPEEVRFPST